MTSKSSSKSKQGHKMKNYFNTLAILACQKLISGINIWVLRPKPRLVSTTLDSIRLQSKA